MTVSTKITSTPASVVSKAVAPAALPSENNQRAILFYCSLLALQFGLQPMISNRCTPPGASKISVVIATELEKIVIAFFALYLSPDDLKNSTWTLRESLQIAAVPSAIYLVQNLCVQFGYDYLDSMTFTLLNQTKVSSLL
jgi:solute carrier family 35 (UDP-sugar transporter), member A1/2/3